MTNDNSQTKVDIAVLMNEINHIKNLLTQVLMTNEKRGEEARQYEEKSQKRFLKIETQISYGKGALAVILALIGYLSSIIK